MKKVLIFYAAYGGGHYSAANSIKKYLDDNFEVETEIIDCIEYINKVLNKLTTEAYKEMAKKVPYLWGKVYSNSQRGLLGHVSSRTNKVMAIKLKNLIKEKQPDLIVSTHPFSSQMVSYLKRKGKINCKLVTVLTDFAPHDQWLIGHEYTDSFFVANTKMEKYLCDYGVNPSKIHVTGIPLSERFFQKFNKQAIYNEFDLDSSKPVILFFGGGEFGLGKDRTMQILEALINTLNTVQIIAISGRNPKMYSAFKETVEFKSFIYFYQFGIICLNTSVLFKISFYRHIPVYGGQSFAHKGKTVIVHQLCSGTLWLHFIDFFVYFFNGCILANKLCRSLFSDARNSRNVI